jgi:Asp-tRNA(Asn)/Glu-tRNA(Gln) amidotransferase A subunit family amidase
MREAWHSMSISRLAPLLARGEVSPVEVTEQFLERIRGRDRELNAYLTVDEAGALAQARAAEARLARGEGAPLTGIPLAVKDVLATRGLRTTCASRILENYAPPYDATVCARLREQGAVFLGKVNMDEFAMGSSTETRPSARRIIPGTRHASPAAPAAARPRRWPPTCAAPRWARTPAAPSASPPPIAAWWV